MRRDCRELTHDTYDVIVVGGGIQGACLAWEAVLRGLSVALVEKCDFGGATSANTLKIIHGGLRYLQHGHLGRIRASIRERRTLMRIAPHLVSPLPILIPTYGHGVRGKAVWALALSLYDLIGVDRNRGLGPDKRLPRGRVLSRREFGRLVPGLERPGLTGGALFHDAQAYNPERLLLAFLQSAAKAGARLANYAEVVGFIQRPGRVAGVEVLDRLTGERFEIRSRTVINATGPWAERVLGLCRGGGPTIGVSFAKAINLVTRSLGLELAVGFPPPVHDHARGASIGGARRLLFVTPWRGRSLVGTAYHPFQGDPGEVGVTGAEVQRVVEDIKRRYPAAELSPDDVASVHRGLVPTLGSAGARGDLRLATGERIVDHGRDGLRGLVSVVGVKYTTARLVAERVIDHLFRGQARRPPRSLTSVIPLHGGDVEDFETFLVGELRRTDHRLGDACVRRLARNYGSAYPEVLRHLEGPPIAGGGTIDPSAVHQAEVLHAIRIEMAHTLGDVVFRRTELGTAGKPPDALVDLYARVMGRELAWSAERTRAELAEVQRRFASPIE
jgi:glycerol-3-phosphate dehydrogenase